MTLQTNQSIDSEIRVLEEDSILTYEQVLSLRQNIQWNALANYVVGEAIEAWLETLSFLTSRNYRSGMNELTRRGFINTKMTLQAFSLINHEAIIDRIKTDSKDWTEATRQARAATYISFTGFLDRRLGGMLRKTKPNREEANRTFYKIRDKVKTQAMTYEQWQCWLKELDKVNHRDCMIAKLALQGAKRIGEVLGLKAEQINWADNQITFDQFKTKGVNRQTIITYPASIMTELSDFVGDRGGLVFVTCNSKPVSIGQVAKTFEKAGVRAGIPFKITPHVLRTSAITYFKQKGFNDSEVMGVSGHASSEMVLAYDKSDLADNVSRRVNLVQ